ncbi:hypothetical protein [Pseudomonas mandelii]|uniref:hypothetical protein n=1 Tax=Pseudomonas mandelii TaxID=75612 RepID=UPI0015956888
MSVQDEVLHCLVDFLNTVPGHQLIKLLTGAEPDPVPQFLLVVLDPLLGGLRRSLLSTREIIGLRMHHVLNLDK